MCDRDTREGRESDLQIGVIVEDFTYPLEDESLADRILVACRTPLTTETQTVSGTVSIGFAFS